MAIKLEDFIPSGTNIFGARTPTYLEGLITPEQLKKAQQQSLFQGLLGTAVGYLAQPKNQNYGSAIPYLAKGYLQGMESAQAPFSNLEKDVLMKAKFKDIEREQTLADQKRKMTEQLLNDPRVKGNPLYESMALNNPEGLFTELEKVTPIRKGSKLIKNITGEVVADNTVIEPQKFTELYGTPQQDERYGLVYFPKDPKYPVLDAKGQTIPDYKPLPKETKSTSFTPSAPTKPNVDMTKKIAKEFAGVKVDDSEASVIAAQALDKMKKEKISFDKAVLSILEKATVENPPVNIFGFDIPKTGGKDISKKKLTDDWKIEKIN